MKNHKIILPVSGSSVDREFMVEGIGKKPVQLYVKSNDGKWYLQRPSIVIGSVWGCVCFVGDNNTKVGSQFTLVAVKTSERPKSPQNHLPHFPNSNVVVVIKK